jgi:hypothetical protein
VDIDLISRWRSKPLHLSPSVAHPPLLPTAPARLVIG